MDRIFEAFLQRQLEEGINLANESDLLDLVPVEGHPPDRYVAHFRCNGLVRGDGEVRKVEGFLIGISFPADYLQTVDSLHIVTWLGPPNVFHPNISDRAPVICLGRLVPGTPLTDILYQCFEVITWNKVTMREDDALNRDACAWARRNPNSFPVDTRPLKRRQVALEVREVK